MPTYDNLQRKGLSFPSMCSLCGMQSETSHHLFLQSSFSPTLSNWLTNIISMNINLTSVLTILDTCKRGWSPQERMNINILNAIWFCRNNLRFNNTKPSFRTTVNMIIASTSISGNLTSLTTTNSITDFVLLKAFNVNCHHSKAPKIIEVIFYPPMQSWIKCNTDGAALGSSGLAACGGIFKNCSGISLGYFAYNTGLANSVYAEIDLWCYFGY